MDAGFPQAVTVYGTGLIGGSLALAIKRQFPAIRVFGVDNPATHERARSLGLIEASDIADRPPSDLVILATPVAQILELIETFHPGSPLILDVGSTKVEICGKAEQRDLPFIGGHPMTGTEKAGPEAADASLFAGATFFLCPIRTTPDGALAKISRLLRSIGAMPVVAAPEEHDRIVAQISHLPQLLSTLLADHTAENLQFAGPGVKSMIRLAASPFHVWRDIFETSGSLPRELRAFAERLRSVIDALESGNLEAVQTIFERANRSGSGGPS